MIHRIKNFDALHTSPARGDALAMAEAAYDAIDTTTVIRAHLSVENTTLRVGDHTYDLAAYTRIRVMGFGKVSCAAAIAIESLLRGHITEGAVIDVRSGTCDVIDVSEGTHPRPSVHNVALSERLVGMAKESTAEDLAIVVVSGGGSSLLCWPIDECEQSMRLYNDFLKTNASIEEMNTVRRHLSSVKGGGFAGLLYPATAIGLIFCDIPGDHLEDVASGPTYLDTSTIEDAQRILDFYNLSGYVLKETPKQTRLFERVHNVPVVSNTTALAAMAHAAQAIGYRVINIGSDLYDAPRALVARMFAVAGPKTAVIGAGEPSFAVRGPGGKGGRCQYVSLQAIEQVHESDVFLAFASDGIDNTDAAGAIVDASVKALALAKNLSIEGHLADYNAYEFFEATGSLLFTGVTDANVSDLFVLIRS